jgi:TetR/AcrR family transcriptional repressor of bet genes
VPKLVDHNQRRAELVAATWEVIANKGVQGATLRRIADGAGCTTGRITHYFKNRDELLLCAFERTYDHAEQRMLNGLAVREGLDALRYVIYQTLPLDTERRLEWRVWLAFWSQATADHDEFVAKHQRRYGQWRRGLRELVSAAMKKGELSTTLNVTIAVDLLVATIDGLGVESVLEPKALPSRRVRATVEQLLATFR